jgi:hypothetical protein
MQSAADGRSLSKHGGTPLPPTPPASSTARAFLDPRRWPFSRWFGYRMRGSGYRAAYPPQNPDLRSRMGGWDLHSAPGWMGGWVHSVPRHGLPSSHVIPLATTSRE